MSESCLAVIRKLKKINIASVCLFILHKMKKKKKMENKSMAENREEKKTRSIRISIYHNLLLFSYSQFVKYIGSNDAQCVYVCVQLNEPPHFHIINCP